MPHGIEPRKIAGWEFFHAYPEACAGTDVTPPKSFEELGQVERFFVSALAGCRRVLDVGCGQGWPGLWVASHVGWLVGADAAPSTIQAARRAMASSGIANASFEVVDPDKLPYRHAEFDGAMLCGLLESMDWDSVPRTLREVRRVMLPGGRIAVLDQDWRDVLTRSPMSSAHIRLRKGQLMLRVVERTLDPHTEVTTRFVVDPDSLQGRRMLEELHGRERVETAMTPEELGPRSVIDANYDVSAQFDADSLANLVGSHGFTNVACESVHVPDWGQKVLFLIAASY